MFMTRLGFIAHQRSKLESLKAMLTAHPSPSTVAFSLSLSFFFSKMALSSRREALRSLAAAIALSKPSFCLSFGESKIS
jgi:hypothetical protein